MLFFQVFPHSFSIPLEILLLITECILDDICCKCFWVSSLLYSNRNGICIQHALVLSSLLTSKHVAAQSDILFDLKNTKATVMRIFLFFPSSWMLYMENLIKKSLYRGFCVGLHVEIFNCK